MQILNSLVPIFAVIGLGIVLRKRNFINEQITQGFNRFAYFFGLPLFLFYKLGSAPMGGGLANLFLITLMGATIVTALAGWAAATLMKTKFSSRGALIQACFRGNLAFMGLPLILFTIYELPIEEKAKLEAAVLVGFTPVAIFYNFASVLILAIFNRETESRFSWKQVFKSVALNPLLIACVAGLIVQRIGWEIPTAIFRTCEVVGASAFPMALLGIGSQLASISVSSQWVESLVSTGLKCVFCPLVGWLIGNWLGLTGVELQVILILCAVPTAVSSYVLTDQMKGDSDLAASAVVVGTACSLITLSILLALTY